MRMIRQTRTYLQALKFCDVKKTGLSICSFYFLFQFIYEMPDVGKGALLVGL
jgi:hypothetical protein